MPINTTAKNSLAVLTQSLERGASSLQIKANWLRQHRSNDPIQQMQTDAIIDLCEAVRQLQQAVSTLPLVIPDVEAVRNAAAAAASSTLKTTPITGFHRP